MNKYSFRYPPTKRVVVPTQKPISNENNNSDLKPNPTTLHYDQKADSFETRAYQVSKSPERAKSISTEENNAKPKISKTQFYSAKFMMKCTLCSFQTNNSELINHHFSKEGHFAKGVKVACPHCPYMAASPKELYQHGKRHMEGFVLFSYVCKLCNFKAMSLASIEKHIGHHSTVTKMC